MDDPAVKQAQHYKKRIENGRSRNDLKEILHCLKRLQKLPVGMNVLQITGVGKTVNSLRKIEGDIGDCATLLITVWKRTVKDEMSANPESENEGGSEYSDNECGDAGYDSCNSVDNTVHTNNNELKPANNPACASSSESKSMIQSRSSVSDEFLNSEKSYALNNLHKHDKSSDTKVNRIESVKREYDVDTGRKYESDNSHKKIKISVIKDKSESKGKVNEGNRKLNIDENKFHMKMDENSEELKKSIRALQTDIEEMKYQENKSNGLNGGSGINHGNSTIQFSSESDMEPEINVADDVNVTYQYEHEGSIDGLDYDYEEYNQVHRDSYNKKNLKVEKNKVHDKVREKYKRDNSSHHKERSSSSHRYNEKGNKEVNDRKKHSSSEHHNHKHRSSGDKHSSDHVKDHKHSDRHSKHGSSKIEENHKSNNKESNSSKETQYSKSHSNKHHSSRSSKHDENIDQKSSSKKNDISDCISTKERPKEEKYKIKRKPDETKSVDSSFETALLQISSVSPSTKKKIKTHSHVSSTSFIKSPAELDLLSDSMPLDPLDIDVSALSSEDSCNYSLQPVFATDRKPTTPSEDDALISVMTTKYQKTKVFSGCKSKAVNKVVSLFELCIRILQENIGSIEYTGGVPYMVLKPVLERTSVEQLAMFEKFNPYVQEDSDELWEFHVKKTFRKAVKSDDESWRELYQRCKEEQAEKLQSLRENISLSIANSLPIRKTQLAFVGNYVKPPRNIAKKQVLNGTKPSVSKSSSKETDEPQPSASSIQSVKERLAAKFSPPTPVVQATKSSILRKKIRNCESEDETWSPSNRITIYSSEYNLRPKSEKETSSVDAESAATDEGVSI